MNALSFRKYPSKVLKFLCVIHTWYSLDPTENYMHGSYSVSIDTQFFRYNTDYRVGGFYKCFLTYLYCSKWNEHTSFRHTKSCFPIKKNVQGVQIFCILAHMKAFRYITAYRGKFTKRVLTYLYYTKNNEINRSHSNVKKACFR